MTIVCQASYWGMWSLFFKNLQPTGWDGHFQKNDTNLNVFTEGTDCCDGKITNPVGLYSLVRDHTHGGLKCKGNEVGEAWYRGGNETHGKLDEALKFKISCNEVREAFLKRKVGLDLLLEGFFWEWHGGLREWGEEWGRVQWAGAAMIWARGLKTWTEAETGYEEERDGLETLDSRGEAHISKYILKSKAYMN